MLTFEEAKARILSNFSLLGSELVSLDAGVGRVLAEDLIARRTQPPADLSAMDGYAVRSYDLTPGGTTLTVIEALPAGSVATKSLAPGQAARIFTGAALPDGADAILIQENVQGLGCDEISTKALLEPGTYVRPRGLDFAEGALGICANTKLTARHIGLAAAMNHPWLMVRRKPRVAILSTGSELRNPGEPLAPGQIISANSASLSALVRQLGAQVLSLGLVADDPDALVAALDQAKGCDLIVTSGGASVGDHDLVGNGLKDLGLDVAFWKIAMRPGKPLIFGNYKGTPLLGLPGNPVSSMVGGIMLVAPILACLEGQLDPSDRWEPRVLAADIPANDERLEFMRAIETDDGGVRSIGRQDSSIISKIAHAQGFIWRPARAELMPQGSTVAYLPLAPYF